MLQIQEHYILFSIQPISGNKREKMYLPGNLFDNIFAGYILQSDHFANTWSPTFRD